MSLHAVQFLVKRINRHPCQFNPSRCLLDGFFNCTDLDQNQSLSLTLFLSSFFFHIRAIVLMASQAFTKQCTQAQISLYALLYQMPLRNVGVECMISANNLSIDPELQLYMCMRMCASSSVCICQHIHIHILTQMYTYTVNQAEIRYPPFELQLLIMREHLLKFYVFLSHQMFAVSKIIMRNSLTSTST